MEFFADLHIHSRFSRATSRDMTLPVLNLWARKKGIQVLGTGDFTHPTYFEELKESLAPAEPGLLVLKEDPQGTRFCLTAELSNMFKQGGKGRRTHTLVLAPNLEVVERLNRVLDRWGKLKSDGRPIFGFSAKDLVKMVLDQSPDCLLVPAHAWTPWFSVLGAASGFESLEACYEEELCNIHAIETGLSSDPAMNFRVSSLDGVTLLSNSDAHSPRRLGREANWFSSDLSYFEMIRVIREKDPEGLKGTIEFFPEEGKYHFDGHRNCGVCLAPSETRELAGECPVCGKSITVGVMHRVEDLADTPSGHVPEGAIPAYHAVPLEEIIAQAMEKGENSRVVQREYERMIAEGGGELPILLTLLEEEISRFAHPRVTEGILRVREGKIKPRPGYDGVYGKILLFAGEDLAPSPGDVSKKGQLKLF
jgi:uncharacterized protein (TIGR00375 family)